MRSARKAGLTAGDIMSRNLVTVPMSATLEALAVILHENHISGAPVVDDAGHLIGVVSQSDLVRHDMDRGRTAPDTYYRHLDETDVAALRARFIEEDYGGALVADIYTPYTVTAAVDSPVSTLATLMVEKGIHRVIVTSGKKVAGIVTSMDVLRTMMGPQVERGAACLTPH